VVWLDDTPCFATRPGSRKARNLAHDPGCVVTVASDDIDLVVEGNAESITDVADLHSIADHFHVKYQWKLAVRGSRVHGHALPGPPEYHLYRLRPTLAFGYGARRPHRNTLAIYLTSRTFVRPSFDSGVATRSAVKH